METVTLTKEQFIGLCSGELSIMDITGMTLYEFTGDPIYYEEDLDNE